MSIINISHLSFGYDGSYDTIFDDVSFNIDTDWRLGFTGRNGRGKTTFLQLLCGKYEYRGRITASVDFEYFPYEIKDKNRNTTDVIAGINAEIMEWKLIRELSLLEIDKEVLYRPFHTLSNGEQTKILLAVLFLKANSFLLIDEPTNHLDMAGRAVVSKYLKSKQGFILVSHDRAFLDGCIDHVLSINKTNIEIQSGTFSSWLNNKQRQDGFERGENEKLKKEVKRLQKTAKEKAGWSKAAEERRIGFDPVKTEKNINRRPKEGAKSKKLMKRAKAMEERRQTAVNDKAKLLKNIENNEDLLIRQASFYKDRFLELKNVSIFYGAKTACHDISFTVERGDRIALTGKNGSGKSSLLKLIYGEEMCFCGEFLKASRLNISYVSQDAQALCGDLSTYAAANHIDETIFKTNLRKLDFSREQFDKDMRDFSGGQKKKVLLAKSLAESAHLCVWDEPLNYIDVISRIQIEELLLRYEPTIIFVEHDQVFCQKIATKVISL